MVKRPVKKSSRKTSGSKKPKKYTCDTCGVIVTVNKACACDPCDIICCGQNMQPLVC